ncbi:MAG: alcohol dehydrogenase catalytic domain-containing protein [Anaerolineae bacterium]
MEDRVAAYHHVAEKLPPHNVVWPTYGAGFENFGKDSQPIETPMPEIGPDELLVRHDACGLCFSDIKIISLGEKHPRIFRDIRQEPAVQGHEVSMTVVEVGENLRDQYKVGDRFIIQADIFVNGVGYAYGYMIQGGLSLYGKIDQRILNGDDGNYLIPIRPDAGYAETALTEPWACVIAAYALQYRTSLKPGGTTWIVGAGGEGDYTIGAGFDAAAHPARLMLTNVPARFDAWLRARAAELGIEVVDAPDAANPPLTPVDDIVVLGADADLVETVSPRLADFGIVALIADEALSRPVQVDIGRVHYNRWLYVGGRGPDVARAYSDTPVRSPLRPGGRTWFIGAGGPMGRMHVQRALQSHQPPSVIVCTDLGEQRLNDLRETFAAEAEARGIAFYCLNPAQPNGSGPAMSELQAQGFDDIVVLAPVAAAVSEAAPALAPGGVMNIFAGVARGTMATLDLSDVYLKNRRVIGHSASSIDDLRLTLDKVEGGELSPDRSVAAVGSLSAARDGLIAVRDARFSGKVVIFPHIKELPLTPLPDLKDALPTVYARLKDGKEWTPEAEEEFLRVMLPDTEE